MADSLMDFGFSDTAQLAQRQFQNTLSMAHLGMQQDSQARQNEQLQVSKDQLLQQTIGNYHKLADSDFVRATPGAAEQLWSQIGHLAGAPALNMDNIQVGQQVKKEYIDGILSGDPDRAMKGVAGMYLISSPEDASKIEKGLAGFQQTTEKLANLKQVREMNAGKVQAIQDANAKVAFSKPLYTAASSLLRDDLRGTDTPQFKQLLGLAEKAPSDKLLSSSNPLIKDKSAFAHILDGNFVKKAIMFDQEAGRLSEQVNADQKLLTDSEHGIPLPDDLTPAMLRARIETNGTLLGATRNMQEWYESPLDKAKLAAAKAAYKTVDARRMEMEALEKNTHANTLKLQNEALSFRQDEAGLKRAQNSALTEAQRQYYALPANQQNTQAAARISQAVKDSTGVDVTPEDIFKNPNRPLVENKINMTQEKEEAKKVGGGFGEQYIDLQKADVDSRSKMAKYDRMDQLLGQINTGKLAPAKMNIQSIADGLGISVDKSLPAAQAFQALSSEIALTLRNPAGGAGMPGALSDKDREFLQSMTPDLGKTPEGNKLIIESARKLAKRDQDVAKMARDYRKKNGQFDEGFFDQLATYSEKNPLFEKQAAAQGKSKPQSAAPAQAMPTIKSDAEYSKLPSGTVYVGPDGKKRTKR